MRSVNRCTLSTGPPTLPDKYIGIFLKRGENIYISKIVVPTRSPQTRVVRASLSPFVFSLLPVGIPETTGDGHTAEPLRILPDSTIRGGTGE